MKSHHPLMASFFEPAFLKGLDENGDNTGKLVLAGLAILLGIGGGIAFKIWRDGKKTDDKKYPLAEKVALTTLPPNALAPEFIDKKGGLKTFPTREKLDRFLESFTNKGENAGLSKVIEFRAASSVGVIFVKPQMEGGTIYEIRSNLEFDIDGMPLTADEKLDTENYFEYRLRYLFGSDNILKSWDITKVEIKDDGSVIGNVGSSTLYSSGKPITDLSISELRIIEQTFPDLKARFPEAIEKRLQAESLEGLETPGGTVKVVYLEQQLRPGETFFEDLFRPLTVPGLKGSHPGAEAFMATVTGLIGKDGKVDPAVETLKGLGLGHILDVIDAIPGNEEQTERSVMYRTEVPGQKIILRTSHLPLTAWLSPGDLESHCAPNEILASPNVLIIIDSFDQEGKQIEPIDAEEGFELEARLYYNEKGKLTDATLRKRTVTAPKEIGGKPVRTSVLLTRIDSRGDVSWPAEDGMGMEGLMGKRDAGGEPPSPSATTPSADGLPSPQRGEGAENFRLKERLPEGAIHEAFLEPLGTDSNLTVLKRFPTLAEIEPVLIQNFGKPETDRRGVTDYGKGDIAAKVTTQLGDTMVEVSSVFLFDEDGKAVINPTARNTDKRYKLQYYFSADGALKGIAVDADMIKQKASPMLGRLFDAVVGSHRVFKYGVPSHTYDVGYMVKTLTEKHPNLDAKKLREDVIIALRSWDMVNAPTMDLMTFVRNYLGLPIPRGRFAWFTNLFRVHPLERGARVALPSVDAQPDWVRDFGKPDSWRGMNIFYGPYSTLGPGEYPDAEPRVQGEGFALGPNETVGEEAPSPQPSPTRGEGETLAAARAQFLGAMQARAASGNAPLLSADKLATIKDAIKTAYKGFTEGALSFFTSGNVENAFDMFVRLTDIISGMPELSGDTPVAKALKWLKATAHEAAGDMAALAHDLFSRLQHYNLAYSITKDVRPEELASLNARRKEASYEGGRQVIEDIWRVMGTDRLFRNPLAALDGGTITPEEMSRPAVDVSAPELGTPRAEARTEELLRTRREILDAHRKALREARKGRER